MEKEIKQTAVTGGTGCLGLPLLKKLGDNNIDINLLTLPGDILSQTIKNRARIITGNLHSTESLNQLTEDCEIIFHLAGKVHSVPKTKKEEQEFYKVNVEGTKNLLRSAKKNKVKRFVFYSTVGVYGQDANFHGDELSPCQPSSIYAKSKYQAEQLVLESSKNGGPEGIVLRFPVAYGPLDRGNVASLIQAIHGKYFFYFGNGKEKRSMISSRNAAEAAFLAAFKPEAANQIFCITDGVDHTVEALIESICLALGISWRPIHIPILLANGLGKFGDFFENTMRVQMPISSSKVRKLSRSLIFSCEKANKILEYRPIESLEQGIAKEVEWLKKVHGWE